MFTELYREEKREEETEVTRRIKGGIKRRERDPASNQFPKCSPQSRHTKRFTELGREEKGEGEDRRETRLGGFQEPVLLRYTHRP